MARLKEEETLDYIQQNHSRSKQLNDIDITYNSQEYPWQQRYEQEISARLIRIGAEFRDLQTKGEGRSCTEEQRYKTLLKDMNDARQYLIAFCTEIKKATFSVERRDFLAEKGLLKMQDDSNLRSTLGTLEEKAGKGIVVLHYLVRENKTSVWITTRNVRKALNLPLSAKDIRKKVLEYRQILQNKKPAHKISQEIYNDLIKPLEADLQQAKAHAIMLSLDDALRYLPISALYDGEQYLIERYALSIYTPAIGNNGQLVETPQQQWQIAGMGVDRFATVQIDSIEKRETRFPALPYVTQELRGIVNDPEQKTNGIFPGIICLNECFTKERLDKALHSYSVLHLATHFSLNPEMESKSYLLLGGEQILSLDELYNNALFEFSGIDLLTLSACNTAVGKSKDFLNSVSGKEVESFASIAQRRGAEAIMASLWAVDDSSTSELMQQFYKFRKTENLSKLKALQKAQIAFIHKKNTASKTSAPYCKKLKLPLDANCTNQAQTAHTNHPYYWAAFILIGNWL